MVAVVIAPDGEIDGEENRRTVVSGAHMKPIRTMAILASLGGTIFTSQTVHAQQHLVAEKLLADCVAGKSDPGFRFERAQCDSYLAGIYDLLFADKTVAEERCVPGNVNADRLRKIVVDYLRNHPADMSYSAANAVQSAVSKAWPRCSLK